MNLCLECLENPRANNSNCCETCNVRKQNWVKHDNTKSCQNCDTNFGPINRPHHCRMCSLCLCSTCMGNGEHYIASFKSRQKICTKCHEKQKSKSDYVRSYDSLYKALLENNVEKIHEFILRINLNRAFGGFYHNPLQQFLVSEDLCEKLSKLDDFDCVLHCFTETFRIPGNHRQKAQYIFLPSVTDRFSKDFSKPSTTVMMKLDYLIRWCKILDVIDPSLLQSICVINEQLYQFMNKSYTYDQRQLHAGKCNILIHRLILKATFVKIGFRFSEQNLSTRELDDKDIIHTYNSLLGHISSRDFSAGFLIYIMKLLTEKQFRVIFRDNFRSQKSLSALTNAMQSTADSGSVNRMPSSSILEAIMRCYINIPYIKDIPDHIIDDTFRIKLKYFSEKDNRLIKSNGSGYIGVEVHRSNHGAMHSLRQLFYFDFICQLLEAHKLLECHKLDANLFRLAYYAAFCYRAGRINEFPSRGDSPLKGTNIKLYANKFIKIMYDLELSYGIKFNPELIAGMSLMIESHDVSDNQIEDFKASLQREFKFNSDQIDSAWRIYAILVICHHVDLLRICLREQDEALFNIRYHGDQFIDKRLTVFTQDPALRKMLLENIKDYAQKAIILTQKDDSTHVKSVANFKMTYQSLHAMISNRILMIKANVDISSQKNINIQSFKEKLDTLIEGYGKEGDQIANEYVQATNAARQKLRQGIFDSVYKMNQPIGLAECILQLLENLVSQSIDVTDDYRPVNNCTIQILGNHFNKLEPNDSIRKIYKRLRSAPRVNLKVSTRSINSGMRPWMHTQCSMKARNKEVRDRSSSQNRQENIISMLNTLKNLITHTNEFGSGVVSQLIKLANPNKVKITRLHPDSIKFPLVSTVLKKGAHIDYNEVTLPVLVDDRQEKWVFMYHGTKNAEDIMDKGFEHRLVGNNARNYSDGYYGSILPDYAINFGKDNQNHKVLLCAVRIGETPYITHYDGLSPLDGGLDTNCVVVLPSAVHYNRYWSPEYFFVVSKTPPVPIGIINFDHFSGVI